MSDLPRGPTSHRRWRGRRPALRWPVERWIERRRWDGAREDLPVSHFWCDTDDGVRIAGTRLGDEATTAIVIAHGFLGHRSKPRWLGLGTALAARASVLMFDLRGHGQSSGACSAGEHEHLDVHAVVQWARRRGFARVVTVGASLGGAAVVLEAAAYRDVDAVVSISAPALWGRTDTKGARQVNWILLTRSGRAYARHVMGTHLDFRWVERPAPADVVHGIAPTPLLIVHGDDDHFFPLSDAELLHARAGEPKKLLVIPGFGHAEDGFTPAFAETLAREIDAMLARA